MRRATTKGQSACLLENAEKKGSLFAKGTLERHKETEELRAAAIRGDAQAQFEMSVHGLPDEPIWLERAAAQGHKLATISQKLLQQGKMTEDEKDCLLKNYSKLSGNVHLAYLQWMKDDIMGKH